MNLIVIFLLLAVALALPVRLEISGNGSKQGIYGQVRLQYALFSGGKKFAYPFAAQAGGQALSLPAKNQGAGLGAHLTDRLGRQHKQEGLKQLRHLAALIKIEDVRLEIRAGTANAQTMGYLSGAVWALLGWLNVFLAAKVPARFSFVPDFEHGRGIFVDVHGIISMTLGQIIRSGITIGLFLAKMMLAQKISAQRSEDYEQSSY